MTAPAEPPTSPYRFLKPYGVGDHALFFGREEETKILLADIIVSRLVVLFARTGTGKTSLINAGVRPHLHTQGYATFYIRVEEDPVHSARAVLSAETGRRLGTRKEFPAQVQQLSKQLDKPIVLFFDQFEEFFFHVVGTDPERARQFVADVAELYASEDYGVRMVFALREEFLGEMDVFRDEIPEIFAADSNLRLRWLDPMRAEDAIVGPANAEGVALTPGLVERIVAELAETGRAIGGNAETPIEPAQLQIVCDTLWRRRRNGKLTVREYDALRVHGRTDSVAKQILDQRLEEEFERLDTREEVDLLERLLPLLRTERGTKFVREVEGLAGVLDADLPALTALISKLEGSGLVHVGRRDGLDYVELVHDYLAEEHRVAELRRAVRTMLPRRRLRDAIAEDRQLNTDELAELIDALPELELRPDEVELLLESSITHGYSVEPMLELAETAGVSVSRILAHLIKTGSPAEATAAVSSIVSAERADRYRYGLLQSALRRRDVAAGVVTLLGKAPTPDSVRLLENALRSRELRGDAEAALAQLAAVSDDSGVADAAWRALASHIGARLTGRTAREAIRFLAQAQVPKAAGLLAPLLDDPQLARDAEDALATLSQSTHPDVADAARRPLVVRARRAARHGRATPRTIELLTIVADVAAVDVLEALLDDDQLGGEAAAALRTLHSATDPDVVAAAQEALNRVSGTTVVPPVAARKAPLTKTAPSYSDSALEPHFQLLARRIADRGVVPVVGAGASLSSGLPSADALAERLSKRFGYPGGAGGGLTDVATFAAAVAGGALNDELRKVFARPYEPSPLHRTLAQLAKRGHLRVIVTVTYDDLVERALAEARVAHDTLVYQPRTDANPFRHLTPRGPGERPLVLRLAGVISRGRPGEGVVATEDDYTNYVFAVGSRGESIGWPLGTMASSSFLTLGYSARDPLLLAILRLLGPTTRRKSWAVLRDPDPVQERLWEQRGFEIVDVDLDEYARRLEKAVAQLAH